MATFVTCPGCDRLMLGQNSAWGAIPQAHDCPGPEAIHELSEIAGLTPKYGKIPMPDDFRDAVERAALGWCADCPDHEACATGYPCDVVKATDDRP